MSAWLLLFMMQKAEERRRREAREAEESRRKANLEKADAPGMPLNSRAEMQPREPLGELVRGHANAIVIDSERRRWKLGKTLANGIEATDLETRKVSVLPLTQTGFVVWSWD